MSTYNGKPYSSPKNIVLRLGLLRFGEAYATNPFGDLTYGLYVDDSGDLIYRSLTSSTTLGAAGGGSGSAPSWDAIYAGDKKLNISNTTLTFDGTHGSNDVLTITSTGAGTGDLIQITNIGSGKDINGTSSSWSFSKLGVNVMKSTTIAGTAGSTSITLTAGDMIMSDGSLAITDADNAASLSVTNNSATSASMVVIAGSGTFTGNTTSSFATLTASGLTTGTVLYIPVVSLTTGKAINIVGTTALTTGILVNIESGTTGSSLTGAGRMLYVNHTGTATNSGILSEYASAATDETIILKITASGALATGTVLAISASSLTTGFGITVADIDSLTTGIGVHIASSATAIATTGRLLYVNHTGATGTSAVLSEFISSATDETTIVKITSVALVSGINLHIVGTTGMTTGSLIRATTSTAGTVATNGIVSIKATGAFTSASNVGLVDIGASATTAGTIVHITSSASGQTTAQLVNITASGYTTGYTGNVVQITGSSTTGTGTVVAIISANTTAGNAVKITSGVTTTNGRGILLVANALTTGVGIGFAHTTSVIANGGSMVRLSSSSVDTGGSSNGTIIDVAATATKVGTLVKLISSAAAQTTTAILDIVSSGYTTGFTGSVVKITGASTTGTGNVLLVTGVNTTAGNTVKIDATSLTTGTGLLLTSAGVIVTTGELVSFVANSATTSTGVIRASATALTDGWVMQLTGASGDTATSSGGVLHLIGAGATDGSLLRVTASGTYDSTSGIVNIIANSATSGNVMTISATSLTTGSALEITTNTSATGEYIHCYDGAATDFKVSRYGAVTIAGNAIGTSSLTMTNGDLTVTNGNLILTGGHIKNTPQAIVNANTALSIVTLGTTIENNGASTHTMADGTVGQFKYVVCTVYTGNAVITPSNFVGSTITLNAAGDSWFGTFVGTEWVTLSLGGTATVA